MTRTYTVEFKHQGSIHTLQVPENKTILSVADIAGFKLPSSCYAGVCTTCAARITNGGSVDQTDGMGINPDLQKQGYVLLCTAYPRSNLEIETEQENTVYHLQFGKQ
ncbi:soluble [2Fe-2S] ferredoxin [Richelia intracellularis HH01]|jgi:ferredoxin|uniref:Soluble [2Fe-2S] ferredoxin n=1 Tax=Richelia intracellularis HH01 TaxID=1165094 RepID=M1X5U6_9NOST|nr:2Fe-2S iron-sulfur cluster-binding protein [Richelia intracellularis]CCH67621.1 soluble [2Fe-2S] ferredoxin [Richelia intracellularis HH01]HAE05772.1 ferredoxin [Richelia sp.]